MNVVVDRNGGVDTDRVELGEPAKCHLHACVVTRRLTWLVDLNLSHVDSFCWNST